VSRAEPGELEDSLRATSAPAPAPGSRTGVAPAAGELPPVCFMLDHGTATLAGSLVGLVGGRWRLLAAAALPAGSAPDALLRLLADRLSEAAPALPDAIDGDRGNGHGSTPSWPRRVARSAPAQTIAVIAATERTRAHLADAATAAGWVVVAGSAERTDPLALTRLATRPGVGALLVGVADPPDADERDLAGELAVAAAGIAARRSGLRTYLAGPVPEPPLLGLRHGPHIVRVPAPARPPGGPPPSLLRDALAAARAGPDDARRALAGAARSLARVLGLRVEILEVGVSGAARVLASPSSTADGWTSATAELVEVPDAALYRMDHPGSIDRVDHWFTQSLDRARLRDRLAELAIAPWGDLDADGALLRGAALRVAVERLLEATRPVMGRDGADLVIGAGGAWSAVPGPAAAHVMADAIRRPGIAQMAIDHARLLGPLGTIEDEEERDAILADLAVDLLLPLGTLVTPRGMRPNRPAGRLILDAAGGRSEVELRAGGLTLVDLPPGAVGTADFAFRGTPELGPRGRRFKVAVSGGLAGLLLDLRDVPLRLPERPDRRRELLGAWEHALWPERDT
jgi:hypothetical protein